MIPKANRKELANQSAAVGTGYSVSVYQVSTGRTFIMTDIRIESKQNGEGFIIYDGLSAASPTAGTEKLKVFSNPMQMTDIRNGLEFHTGVSIASTDPNHAAGTYVCWVSGYEI